MPQRAARRARTVVVLVLLALVLTALPSAAQSGKEFPQRAPVDPL